eukprot:TRINITY_DN12067_c0_g1_i1.p1 TRINITY_DN12067_c0_g1~~TRINITY_DN12067_c0_g1_i1.p1  ORF type:complete len:757 (-),score=186.65 TRINITY_DN12067_c0_g1_i1:30-2300(-)
MNEENPEVPASFYCPITHDIMIDPVMDNDGNSYERGAITDWLQQNQTSPITREPLQLSDLRPNRALRESIESFREQHPDLEVPTHIVVQVGSAATVVKGSNSDGDVGVRVSVNDDGFCQVVVDAPDCMDRPPTDVVCVIDVSGSMNTEATMKNDTGGIESDGLSLLDMVKHAVKSIIVNMRDDDRIALVSYSTRASIVFDLLPMTEDNRQLSIEKLNGMNANGQTNLWDGLVNGLDILKKHSEPGRIASVFLLTDGQPNIEPPRGHIPMLKKYIDTNQELPGFINTFGFGYTLNSQLLDEIATIGNGSYAFIPDSSFVGTIFVNAVSNLLSTYATNAFISLEPQSGINIAEVIGNYEVHDATWGKKVHLGSLKSGQSKNVILRLENDPGEGVEYLSATLQYYKSGRSSPDIITVDSSLRDNDLQIEAHKIRLSLVKLIDDLISNASLQQYEEVVQDISSLAKYIKGSPAWDLEYVQDVFKDLTGQIMEAGSRKDYFTKWGKHYLPSIRSAHMLQVCNNFKDPGVQHYGGTLFSEIRDAVDDAYNKLPPPVPSNVPRASNTSWGYNAPNSHPPQNIKRRKVKMAKYNRSGGVCFDGSCKVLMENGSLKLVENIKKGDYVMTDSSPAKVLCIVKTVFASGETELVELDDGLKVTPWHPIRINGKWKFPRDLKAPKLVDCDAVYSFLLDGGHVMMINGYECVSLAHQFKGNVVEHSYFGTIKIKEDLQKLVGWDNGEVVLKPGCLVRDPVSQIACGLVQ